MSYQIKTLNKISATGLAKLDSDFFAVSDAVESPDGILVRSADMHDYVFPQNLRAIARAGAGTNNIPVSRCSEEGIVVFNTPGANANAVKELAICALLVSSRNVMGGYDWVREQAKADVDVEKAVEKGKSAFVGPELAGKTLGVLGLGAVGGRVANVATKLDMKVYGYDPYLSVNAALALSRMVHVTNQLDELFRTCDYISLHMPLLDSTRNMIDAKAIEKMKDGVRIINLARGGLVNDDDMIAALESGKVASYVTDFPNGKITLAKNVVAIPHLGASSPESEENCAIMAAKQLGDYLKHGTIKNSVNFPDAEMEWCGETRICIIHRNILNVLAPITNVFSQEKLNIENLINKSKGEYAYSMVDVGGKVGEHSVQALREIEGVLRVRVLRR